MQRRGWCVLLTLALVPTLARADVKPHAICSDGMVLQQKTEAKIWGQADPGEAVSVTFRNKTVTANADANGKWLVAVSAGEAGGPFPMTIAGKNKIQYSDILVGEVWVCSGQSNMEWSIAACDKSDKDAATSAPLNKNLRIFQVKKLPIDTPQTETAGTWRVADPDPKNIMNWTATGYFFGRYLNEKLNVPVGLIQSAWGGTRAEAWTNKEHLNGHPMFAHEHSTPQKNIHANSPSALYNGMIHPILNYNIKGAIWYQGESNAGQAYKYRSLFPLMIENWRKDFHQGDFPFHFVQLAPFMAAKKVPGESTWAELREAQSMTLKLKNTGMAIITDVGNEYDIHPTPKRPVGERLAMVSLGQDYGQKLVYYGPMYKSMKAEGSKIALMFDHVGGGLVSKEMIPTLERKMKDGSVQSAWRPTEKSADLIGFAIAGADRKFVNAKAEIVGNTVVVSCPDVVDPIAVRYGWADHPICNLFNREGLPANPFRTDDFPGVTQPK